MRYLPLSEVRLRHGYYAEERCPDLTVEPAADTERMLRNLRWVGRAFPDGFLIAAQVGADGRPVIAFPPATRLTFRLRVRNPDFPLFTAATDPVATVTTLDTGKAVPEGVVEVRRPGESRRAPGVFAEVQLTCGDWPPALETDGNRFAVRFEARAVPWAYYLVTDTNGAGSEFMIRDASSTDPVRFSARNRTRLNAAAATDLDEVAQALARQYPRLERFRFLSDEPVPFRGSPRRELELVQGDRKLLAPLPNPSVRSACRLEPGRGGGSEPRIAVHRILKHLAR